MTDKIVTIELKETDAYRLLVAANFIKNNTAQKNNRWDEIIYRILQAIADDTGFNPRTYTPTCN